MLCVAFLIVLITGGVALFFLLKEKDDEAFDYDVRSVSNGFHRHTVVSNGPECAPIGM